MSMSAAPRPVGINVGGRVYFTSRETLCRDGDSMLAHMFSNDLPPASQDKDGNFVIDRDGDTFKYILNYLRDGVCVLPLLHSTRAELLREADYFQLAGLSRQLRRGTADLSCTASSLAAALLVPDANSQKLMVLEALRSEAGIENIAAAERAMLAVAYGTDDESVMARAALAAKQKHQRRGLLDCSAFNAETPVLAMETNYRIIALSLGPTGSIADYPLLEEDYLAHGAHCTGSDFARFVWQYQQVIQHDLLLLGYVVLVEKGTETFEERNSGVFWVTLSSDVHPPSPKPRCRLRRSSLSSNIDSDELQHVDSH